MIASREEIASVLRGNPGEVVVNGNPPDIGATAWLRVTAGSKPVCEVSVVEVRQLSAGGHALLVEKVVAEFELPKKPAEDGTRLHLSAEQRAALFAGDHRALYFESEPDCETSDRYVLIWSRVRRIYDGVSDQVTVIPRQPVLWIEITHKVRRADDWMLRFNVFDLRQRRRLPRRVPDLGAAEPEITSDPHAAIDHLEQGESHYDETNLFVLAEARSQFRHLHEDRDRAQETRMLTHRFRRARARAHERGVDDSRQVALIAELIRELEEKAGEAA